ASSAYESAIRVDPEDYYAQYLWGRNLRQRGDPAAAIETLKYALQLNDQMVEILGELGYASMLAGRDEDAIFYFEEYRKRAGGDFRLLYLHGLALLKQNRIDESIVLFRESAALAGDHPDPDNGLAYALHARGEIDEALAAFARVIRRFERNANDPRYTYAEQWMARVEEHRRKSQWIDGFERKTIKNAWDLQQRSGPKIDLVKNRILIQGVQRQEQPDTRTALRREIPGTTFRIFEADLSMGETNQARCGIYLGLYINRGAQGALTKAEVILALDMNGALVYQVVDKGNVIVEWQELPREKVLPNTPVRLSIEVVDYEEGRLRLYADGEPVLAEDLEVKSLKKGSRSLQLGIFAAAPGSRKVDVTADNARIVVRN
ncbi:MAG: tetratricopeptide repeat protein, partial [Planctomycetes bacterium]|nr:tetratricopeptide repeat protein [Planctomycetota bacterium]